ncbi:restriction endonuclease subunit S [Yersinia ruckeri]
MVPEGWLISTLDNFIDIKHGFAFKSDYFRSEGEYVLTTPGHFFEVGGFRDQGNKTKYYVGEVPKGYLLKKGDVLLAMTEQTAGLLGSAIYVPESDRYLHNQRLGLVLVRDHERICKEYIYLIYNSPTTRKTIAEQASGTKVKHTSPSRLLGVKVLIPPLSEQKKIAQILSAWDKAIAITEQLIANSQRQKKALMQQLLTGKSRFSGFTGKWEKFNLGDLGDTYTGLSGKSKDDFGSGKTYIPYINIFKNSCIDIHSFELVAIRDGERQNKAKFGDIFFTTSSETPEEVGMSSVLLDHVEELYLNSFCFGFRLNDFNILRPEYARYYFRSEHVRKEISILGQGATRYNLSKKQLMKLTLKLPSVDEQIKIASVLSIADQEIESLKNQLNHLKQEKKALIQQLLTGKRRVKTDAA